MIIERHALVPRPDIKLIHPLDNLASPDHVLLLNQEMGGFFKRTHVEQNNSSTFVGPFDKQP